MSLLSKIFPDISQSKQFSLDIILSHFLGIDDIKEDQERKCCLYNPDVMGVISLKFFNFPFLFMISPRYEIFCLIKKLTKCIFCLKGRYILPTSDWAITDLPVFGSNLNKETQSIKHVLQKGGIDFEIILTLRLFFINRAPPPPSFEDGTMVYASTLLL